MSTSGLLTGHRWSVETDAISVLLRTELSACETYRTAIREMEKDSDCPALSLRCLYRSHRRFADELRGLARRQGGLPAESAGTSGLWSGVHERIAELPGHANFRAILRALRQGERYSLELARSSLLDPEGPLAAFAKGKLVEGITANIALLEALERSAEDDPEDPAA